MRLLAAPALFVVLLGQAPTPVGGRPAPVPVRPGDQPPVGQPAKKPVKYVPLPVKGMPGTDWTAPCMVDGIPVYYVTREGLARAREVGPIFLGPESALQYRGRVVGVTEKFVTLKPAGHVQSNDISFNPDTKVKEERVYLQDNTEPPRTFVFGEGLLAPPPGGPIHGHAVGDLRMGDLVHVACSRRGGADYCHELHIHRRPGAQVPPMASENHYPPHIPRWHERMNAEQAREERAVLVIQRLGLRLLR